MEEQPNQPQNPPAGDENPEVYSVSQDQDGFFRFSRRDFLFASAAIGGTLLVRGVCPRFAARAAGSGTLQAGMAPLPGVYIHKAPNIASNITDTLQPDDFVRLISDRPDLGWAEVAAPDVQRGWVKRSSVDFSQAIRSSSPDFPASGTPTPPPPQKPESLSLSLQLRQEGKTPQEASAAGQPQACGEAIQNGDFEDGNVSWVEDTTGYIIRTDWPDPYQGSWVAWMGGLDATERLTQLFHVPEYVQDAQTLEFWIKVTSEETAIQVYDTLVLRFLDAAGNPVTSDIAIANNTTKTDWFNIHVNLTGMSLFAGLDMQIQFEAVVNVSNITSFVLDSVSLNLICDDPPPVYYVYLPVVVRDLPPEPTETPCATDCPSDCPSYCAGDCPSDCGSDYCSTDYCSSDCTLHCIYDCTFDCIYDYCTWDW
jgi:hypothetical protein